MKKMDYKTPIGTIKRKSPELVVAVLNKEWQKRIDLDDGEQKFVLRKNARGDFKAQLMRKPKKLDYWIRDFAFYIKWDEKIGCYSL